MTSSATRSRRRNTAWSGWTAFGGAMMLVLGTIRGEWTLLTFSTRTAVAFGYLSTVGAIGGFVAYTTRSTPTAST